MQPALVPPDHHRPPDPKPQMSLTPIPRGRRQLVVGAVTVAVLGVVTGPSVAAGQPQLRTGRATFGIRPAPVAHADTRALVELNATPGAFATDRVVVSNYSPKALRLHVYATDAIDDDKGNLTLLPTTKHPTGAGTWISVVTPRGSGVVSVPADAKVVLPVRISVPTDASPGDHLAGIVAELDTRNRSQQLQVRLQQRVGTKVLFHIAGQVRPSLRVEDLRASYRGTLNPFGTGAVRVSYRLVNAGNTILGADQTISVHGWWGSARTVPTAVAALLPGSSVSVSATLRGVRPGVVEHADVTVVPRLTSVNGPTARAVRSSHRFWALPWPLAALLVLASALAVWTARRFRARRPAGGRHRALAPFPDVVTPMEELPT